MGKASGYKLGQPPWNDMHVMGTDKRSSSEMGRNAEFLHFSVFCWERPWQPIAKPQKNSKRRRSAKDNGR